MKKKSLLTWLSGFLLMGSAWQLEIVQIRATSNQTYSLPFFIVTTQPSFTWSLVWLLLIFISYLLLVLAHYRKTKTLLLSFLLFTFSLLQLAILHARILAGKPYFPPFTKLIVKGQAGSPIFQPSFWGDVWMTLIIISFFLLLFQKISIFS